MLLPCACLVARQRWWSTCARPFRSSELFKDEHHRLAAPPPDLPPTPLAAPPPQNTRPPTGVERLQPAAQPAQRDGGGDHGARGEGGAPRRGGAAHALHQQDAAAPRCQGGPGPGARGHLGGAVQPDSGPRVHRAPHAGHAPVDAQEVRRDPAHNGPPAQHAAVALRDARVPRRHPQVGGWVAGRGAGQCSDGQCSSVVLQSRWASGAMVCGGEGTGPQQPHSCNCCRLLGPIPHLSYHLTPAQPSLPPPLLRPFFATTAARSKPPGAQTRSGAASPRRRTSRARASPTSTKPSLRGCPSSCAASTPR